jgi:acetyltransferase
MLVILTPQSMTDPTKTAEHLKPYAHIEGKPVLASFMGGTEVAAGVEILNRVGIPTFSYPDTAARAFYNMWRFAYNLRGLYETPMAAASEEAEADKAKAGKIIKTVRDSGRTILTEFESKQLLATYGIPTVETRVAASLDEAVALAKEIGFPVVLKLFSETITHKTDVGGVQLNLRNEDAVRAAFNGIQASVAAKVGIQHFQGVTVQPMIKLDGYELIVGSSVDAQFGPVLLFGMGGQLVEVFKDRALALPPLTTTLARRMMEQTKIYEALKGVRGRKAVDLAALEQLLVRFGQLVVEQPWIKEIDINPLLASEERLIALDARVVVHGLEVTKERLPKLSIRPYPTRYVGSWTAKDGTAVLIRPIRPEDEPLVVKFHETLSERSVYQRYLHTMQLSQRIAHERLTRICFIDYDREMALVAEVKDPAAGEPRIVAVGRLKKTHGTNEAEFALIISDEYQGRGLGSELLRRLLDVGKHEQFSRITGDILPDNLTMQRICEKLGFELKRSADEPVVKVTLGLEVLV